MFVSFLASGEKENFFASVKQHLRAFPLSILGISITLTPSPTCISLLEKHFLVSSYV